MDIKRKFKITNWWVKEEDKGTFYQVRRTKKNRKLVENQFEFLKILVEENRCHFIQIFKFEDCDHALVTFFLLPSGTKLGFKIDILVTIEKLNDLAVNVILWSKTFWELNNLT